MLHYSNHMRKNTNIFIPHNLRLQSKQTSQEREMYCTALISRNGRKTVSFGTPPCIICGSSLVKPCITKDNKTCTLRLESSAHRERLRFEIDKADSYNIVAWQTQPQIILKHRSWLWTMEHGGHKKATIKVNSEKVFINHLQKSSSARWRFER